VAIVHQSDLSSWIRCPHAYMLSRRGQPQKQTSALSYGSVMHHALQVFEIERCREGVPFAAAVTAAVETFDYYWHPLHIEVICPRVELWYPQHTYGGLRTRGMEAIKAYAQLMKYDDHELLATEFSFRVPIVGTWDETTEEPHTLVGTVDRLAVRHYTGKLAICVDDYKTGAEYRFLRQNLQFTAYLYATTQPQFWIGWQGEDGFGEERGTALFERFAHAGRRGTWINMKTIKFQDAGWRGPKDYDRFALAVEQVLASINADIYPLSLSGEHCTYCTFRDVCAGVGVPESAHGAPIR
jgi:hypothetical protein